MSTPSPVIRPLAGVDIDAHAELVTPVWVRRAWRTAQPSVVQ
jgi:hypothetical protein